MQHKVLLNRRLVIKMSCSDDDCLYEELDFGMPTMDVSLDDMMKQHASSKAVRSITFNRPAVPNKHLSLETLIDLLYDINPEHVDVMVSLTAKYDMVVSTALKGWKGMDCKLCVKLLHITCEWKSDRVRLPDRSSPVAVNGRIKPTLSETDHVILSYYQGLWQHYQQCFRENVPYIMTVEKQMRK
jgi:hypothetical protein